MASASVGVGATAAAEDPSVANGSKTLPGARAGFESEQALTATSAAIAAAASALIRCESPARAPLEVRRQQAGEVFEEVEERDQEEGQADEVRRPLAPELADAPRRDPDGGTQQREEDHRK